MGSRTDASEGELADAARGGGAGAVPTGVPPLPDLATTTTTATSATVTTTARARALPLTNAELG